MASVTVGGVDRGWDASGRLTPLYQKVGGVDRLAELSGISRPLLSGYNSGRRQLGVRNAARIAAAAGVTPEDLGMPPVSAVAGSAGQLDRRLQALQADFVEFANHRTTILGDIHQTLADLQRQISAQDERLQQLERGSARLSRQPTRGEDQNNEPRAAGNSRN